MSAEENKALVKRYVEEVLNKKDYSGLDRFFDPGHVQHTTARDSNGIDGMQQYYDKLFTAFPDMHTTVDHIIAEGDYVVTCQVLTGTHRGIFMGIPPAGKPFKIQQMAINRIADGKFVESWAVADMLGMRQQLEGDRPH
jgi:predicted ester cyclase